MTINRVKEKVQTTDKKYKLAHGKMKSNFKNNIVTNLYKCG